jgi:hypothetical protein
LRITSLRASTPSSPNPRHEDRRLADGDFNRDKGRQVAEALLQAHPEANVIYAHNDEMAIGAISAIEAAGKKPGKDITRRLDRRREGRPAGDHRRQDGRDRRMQSALRSGAYAAAIEYSKGEKIPPIMTNKDHFYDASNAAASIAGSY